MIPLYPYRRECVCHKRRQVALTNLRVLEGLVDASLMLPVGGVEVVLDAVVGAAGQFFSNVGPLVS